MQRSSGRNELGVWRKQGGVSVAGAESGREREGQSEVAEITNHGRELSLNRRGTHGGFGAGQPFLRMVQ